MPNTVIAMDQKSSEFVRPICRKYKVGLISVKAGGGWPRLYYPGIKHQVHFINNDLKYARKKFSLSEEESAWIPNRVEDQIIDIQCKLHIQQKYDLRDNEKIIIRVGRIHKMYQTAFESSIALAKFLRKNGIPSRTLIIGSPQDQSLLVDIKKMASDEDIILTEEFYTKNARRFIPVAHFNVGVGRGFMEGCALGQVMFCAGRGLVNNIPILVNAENFMLFFDNNFSMRANCSGFSQLNESSILKNISDSQKLEQLGHQSRHWFEEYFEAEKIPDKYKKIIEHSSKNPEKFNLDHLMSELHLRNSEFIDFLKKFL